MQRDRIKYTIERKVANCECENGITIDLACLTSVAQFNTFGLCAYVYLCLFIICLSCLQMTCSCDFEMKIPHSLRNRPPPHNLELTTSSHPAPRKKNATTKSTLNRYINIYLYVKKEKGNAATRRKTRKRSSNMGSDFHVRNIVFIVCFSYCQHMQYHLVMVMVFALCIYIYLCEYL